jgi:hypothetical protein
MRRIALLTALAMATPAVAFAQTRVYERDREPVRVYERDRDPGVTITFGRDPYDRYDRYHANRDFRGRWVPLARANSTNSDRQFIPVRGETFRKIRVEGVRGRPVIQKIAIEFMDRTTQAVDLDMRLRRGSGEVIDLNGGVRRINRIIVYTDPRFRGSYTLYGA